MGGPLSSLKILDFSTLLPGPFATMLLADLGADIVRVEAPARSDLIREQPPSINGTSAAHATLNRSKRSIVLDLKQPAAAEVVRRLVQTYDIVVEQFRPGTMEQLDVGYKQLRTVNPRLIYCAISGYGQDGPYRDRAGHDINYLALSGVAGHSGRRESGPPPLGVQLADVGGGSYGALLGILAAVIHRRQTGEGQFVDVSMFDGLLAWNVLAASAVLAEGDDLQPEEGLLNGGSYYDYYQTADGRYLAVGSLEPKFWRGFCRAIGRPDLEESGLALPLGEQTRLKAEIQREIEKRPLKEWVALFAEVDVCVEPVLTVAEALADPQAEARSMVVSVPGPDDGTVRQVAHPLKFSASRPVYRHIGVEPGAHSEEVLREAGYNDREIAALREARVLG